jgi:hypothetical protein
MTELTIFRDYALSQTSAGQSWELRRTDSEVVVLAFDQVRQRLVELHVLTALHVQDLLAQPAIAVFQSRLRQLRLLDESTIVPVVDGGVDDESLYYVVDFLDGEALADYLQRTHPVPPWLALQLVRDLLHAANALMGEPALVREVDWLQSIVWVRGSAATDLRAAVIDVGLTASLASQEKIEPHQVVDETLKKLSQLLIFALTGIVAETLEPADLAQWPIPAVCRQLLRQWQTAVGGASADFSLAIREIEQALPRLSPPPTGRMAPALRPRLRFQDLLLDPDELAARLARSHRVEAIPFDALRPYEQRVFGPDEAVAAAQLMPSPRLVPPHWAAEVKRVHTATGVSHVLAILDPAVLGAEHYVEAAVTGPTLAQWRVANPAPCALVHLGPLIRQLAQAVIEAESAGLSWMRVTPADIFLATSSAGAEDDFPWLARPITEWPSWRWVWRLHPCLRQWVETPVLPEPMTPRQQIESLIIWMAGSPQTWPAPLQRVWAEDETASVSEWIDGLAQSWPQPVQASAEVVPVPTVKEPTQPVPVPIAPAPELVEEAPFSEEVDFSPVEEERPNPVAAFIGMVPSTSVLGVDVQYPVWPAFRREDEEEDESEEVAYLSAESEPGLGEMMQRADRMADESWLESDRETAALSFGSAGESMGAPWVRTLILVVVLAALMIAFMLHLTGAAPWQSRG